MVGRVERAISPKNMAVCSNLTLISSFPREVRATDPQERRLFPAMTLINDHYMMCPDVTDLLEDLLGVCESVLVVQDTDHSGGISEEVKKEKRTVSHKEIPLR